MKNQIKYFLIGLILLFCAVFCVTLLPLIVKIFFKHFYIQNYIYSEIEFLLMILCAVLYLFSPKFYKLQIVSIGVFAFLYFMFVKYYPLINQCFKMILSSFSL